MFVRKPGLRLFLVFYGVLNKLGISSSLVRLGRVKLNVGTFSLAMKSPLYAILNKIYLIKKSKY